MKFVSHIVLTIISLSLAILIFLISHEKIWIKELKSFGIENLLYSSFFKKFDPNILKTVFPFLIYLGFLLFLILITWLIIQIIKRYFNKIYFSKNQLVEFEQANDFYLPIYLGYSFVAISLPTIKSFILFFLIMILILARTRFFYFNPLFLVLGYKFYFILDSDKVKFLLITKKDLKNPDDIFQQMNQTVALTRLNNHTYILF